MKIIHKFFDTKGAPLLMGIFVALFLLEQRKPLRKRVQRKSKRMLLNGLISIPSYTLLRFLFLPLVVKLAEKNQRLHCDVLSRFQVPPFAKAAMSFLILDYGNYIWHVLNHRLPALWRFHAIHHIDLDLDVSNAIRFHFGELIGSVFFRGFFILISGATPLQVLTYEIAYEGATQFHHSNWRLPSSLEKTLNLLLVTPRMHGIHHSAVAIETNSNFAVIFSMWDRLHRTHKSAVNQEAIRIGIPMDEDPSELSAWDLLKRPFQN